MSRNLDGGLANLSAPAWEPMGDFLYGHGGFSDLRSMQSALFRQTSRNGSSVSRGEEMKAGLTRRGVIYEYINAHPGVHVRGMAKELGIATGDMQYHLSWLERHGLVRTRRSGFYRFVYPSMVFNESQEVLLGVLSQETSREIVLWLMTEAALTQSDLAKRLGHSQPTVSWHMDRLVQVGLVCRSRNRKGLMYELVADREEVVTFVKRYHPGVWKRWSGRLPSTVSEGVRRASKVAPTQGLRLTPAAVVELIGKR